MDELPEVSANNGDTYRCRTICDANRVVEVVRDVSCLHPTCAYRVPAFYFLFLVLCQHERQLLNCCRYLPACSCSMKFRVQPGGTGRTWVPVGLVTLLIAAAAFLLLSEKSFLKEVAVVQTAANSVGSSFALLQTFGNSSSCAQASATGIACSQHCLGLLFGET